MGLFNSLNQNPMMAIYMQHSFTDQLGGYLELPPWKHCPRSWSTPLSMSTTVYWIFPTVPIPFILSAGLLLPWQGLKTDAVGSVATCLDKIFILNKTSKHKRGLKCPRAILKAERSVTSPSSCFLFGSCRGSRGRRYRDNVLPDDSKVGMYRSHPIYTQIFFALRVLRWRSQNLLMQLPCTINQQWYYCRNVLV